MTDITSTENVNVANYQPLITPEALKQRLPLYGTTLDHVRRNRRLIRDILDRKDPRLFVAAFKDECVRFTPDPQGGVEPGKGNRCTRIGKRPAC